MSLSQKNYLSVYRSFCIFYIQFKNYIQNYFRYRTFNDFLKIIFTSLILQALGDNLQGFMNCLLYCVFTPKVFNHIKQKILTCCKCSSPTCCTLRSHGRYFESFDAEEEEGANLFKKWNEFVSHVIKFIGWIVTSVKSIQYNKNNNQ